MQQDREILAEQPGPCGARGHPGFVPGWCLAQRAPEQASAAHPGCGGPELVVWNFSEGAFLGKCVWEMRFYPSLYFPEESERPSIIHRQTGCLSSQHTQTCSWKGTALRSCLLPALPSPAFLSQGSS